MSLILRGNGVVEGLTDLPAGTVTATDLSSTLDLSSKTITLATDAAVVSKLSTASGSAPSYSARAWVNFNGTGTVAIRESGNVSSITDNGTGDYTVNFTTAMPDENFAAVASGGQPLVGSNRRVQQVYGYSTSSISIEMQNSANNDVDPDYVSIAVFR